MCAVRVRVCPFRADVCDVFHCGWPCLAQRGGASLSHGEGRGGTVDLRLFVLFLWASHWLAWYAHTPCLLCWDCVSGDVSPVLALNANTLDVLDQCCCRIVLVALNA